MLLLTRGQDNDVIVTLKENQTLEVPNFLFVFTNDQTGGVTSCIAANISEFENRYNEFIITEKDSPDNLAGEVSLKNTGFYHYDIYEQNSDTNLNPDNAINLLETGKAKVIAMMATIPAFSSSIEKPVFKQ